MASSVPDWLDRFDGIVSTGKGWSVRCPTHEDRQPSLSIDPGGRGWLLYCHRGCDTHHIMAAIGLTTSDLYYEEHRITRRASDPEADAKRRAAEFFQAAAPYRPCTKLHTFEDIAADVMPIELEARAVASIFWHDDITLPFEDAMLMWINMRDGWVYEWLGKWWSLNGKTGWREFTQWMNRKLWSTYRSKGCSTCPSEERARPVPG